MGSIILSTSVFTCLPYIVFYLHLFFLFILQYFFLVLRGPTKLFKQPKLNEQSQHILDDNWDYCIMYIIWHLSVNPPPTPNPQLAQSSYLVSPPWGSSPWPQCPCWIPPCRSRKRSPPPAGTAPCTPCTNQYP